ncbi:MAG: bifunctional protein conserved domain protein [Planctomycetaceae bacterium]|nr:bifunctional protein conserved domain protein [Planctomycetaceae bacterium]
MSETPASQPPTPRKTASATDVHTSRFTEEVEVAGHIIDSLILPKILDEIMVLGGRFKIADIKIGQQRHDPSRARLLVEADSASELQKILASINRHGAVMVHDHDCTLVPADMNGAFPEDFYCTTNQETEVRLNDDWIQVELPEMDCGLKVNVERKTVETVPMTDVRQGDLIVVGHQGVRVAPQQRDTLQHDAFSFMNSTVSSEKPKGVTVREIAAEMRKAREGNGRILIVAGPAVVHTGSRDHLSKLIQAGFVNVLFAGNALATHDMEQSLFGTSLGITMDHGRSTEGGHEHHLRTINRIRRLGGIRQAVEQGVITSGIMYECIQKNIPYVLCGSIRDDGPLPDVVTDALESQRVMRQHVPGLTFCLMIATTLHSIAVGNLLPARVKVVCVDINPATVTKLGDRGTFQTIGLVTDVEPFLRVLTTELGL